MEIGAQLYTVREHCTTLEDFALTLRKVADIGYKTVQVSGACPFEPEWLKAQLKQNGLKCVITHTDGARICAEPEKVAAEHDVFECKYIGLGSYGFNPDRGESLENLLATYREPAERLKACGKMFMYHHHAKEFNKQDGKLILDHICESIPADRMGIILDTYWVQVGGADPAQWLEKLAGRVPCIHLKDCAFGPQMAVLGEGNMNFDRIFEKAETAGTKYMLVEQDRCYGEDPYDCLTRSYQYLRAHGFE